MDMLKDIAPGPWEVEGEGQKITGVLAVGDNHYVAYITGWEEKAQSKIANTIAALPDIITALQTMYEVFGMEYGCENMGSVVAARNVLTKIGNLKGE
jgi:hypothetical protein